MSCSYFRSVAGSRLGKSGKCEWRFGQLLGNIKRRPDCRSRDFCFWMQALASPPSESNRVRIVHMARSSTSQREEVNRSTPVPVDLRGHGLWVFESRHDQTFVMPVTEHPFFKLLLIREGAGEIEFERARLSCETGSLVLVPANSRHRIIDRPRDPISLYGLGIELKQLASVASVLETFPPSVHEEATLRTLSIEQRLRKLLYLNDQMDSASQLSSIATAIDLIAELSLLLRPPRMCKNAKLSANRNPLMETYLAWLHRNFFQPLSLADAVAVTDMSRRTFTNQFKTLTGSTWLNYVNMLRIHHAEYLLKETDHKITSIAFQCGYEDLTTFYRAFKRINGKHPRSLRRRPGKT